MRKGKEEFDAIEFDAMSLISSGKFALAEHCGKFTTK
jgi:hypothetical protein